MDQIPEQAIFVIVFLIIGAVRWFLENRAQRNRPPEEELWEEPDLIERASPISHSRRPEGLEDLYKQARREIQERQSREASADSVREKLQEYRAPQQAPPPLPLETRPKPIQKPSLKTEAAKGPVPNAYELKKVRRPVLTAAQQQAVVNFEQMGQEKKPLDETDSRIRRMLLDPKAARDAIILTEILGKPKGA